jgi:hypothetical protein
MSALDTIALADIPAVNGSMSDLPDSRDDYRHANTPHSISVPHTQSIYTNSLGHSSAPQGINAIAIPDPGDSLGNPVDKLVWRDGFRGVWQRTQKFTGQVYDARQQWPLRIMGGPVGMQDDNPRVRADTRLTTNIPTNDEAVASYTRRALSRLERPIA